MRVKLSKEDLKEIADVIPVNGVADLQGIEQLTLLLTAHGSWQIHRQKRVSEHDKLCARSEERRVGKECSS